MGGNGAEKGGGGGLGGGTEERKGGIYIPGLMYCFPWSVASAANNPDSDKQNGKPPAALEQPNGYFFIGSTTSV